MATVVSLILREEDQDIVSKLREIFRNSTFSMVNHGATTLLNAIIVVLFARYLGPVLLGQYTLAQSLVGIVFNIVNLGIGGILVRETAKEAKKMTAYLGNCLGIQITVSVPFGLLFTTILALGLGFRGQTLVVILLYAVFLISCNTVGFFYGLFQASKKFEYQLSFNLLYKVLCLTVTLLLLSNGYGLVSVIFSYILLQFFISALAGNKVRKLLTPIKILTDINKWRQIIKESYPLAMSGTVEFLNLKSDTVLLGVLLGETITGIYNAAYTIYLGATAMAYAVIVAFFPTISQTYHHNPSQGAKLFRSMSLLLILASSLLAIVLYLSSPFIIQIMYGTGYSEAVIPLSILAVGLPFITLNRLTNYTLVAIGLQKWCFYASTAGALFNVVMNLLLIPKYSFIAASVTTVLTEGLVFLAGLVRVCYRFSEVKQPGAKCLSSLH